MKGQRGREEDGVKITVPPHRQGITSKSYGVHDAIKGRKVSEELGQYHGKLRSFKVN